MNYLQARRLVDGGTEGDELPLFLGMSGLSDPLKIYLQAAAVEQGRTLRLETPLFGTLQQALTEYDLEEPAVFFLCPWDLLSELDWRSGIAKQAPSVEEARDQVKAQLAAYRARGPVVYLEARIPPLFSSGTTQQAFEAELRTLVLQASGRLVDREHFSLSSYLATGCPIAGQSLGTVAMEVVAAALSPAQPAVAKVLVTDLDNTLWAGIVGDDGIEAIESGPHGRGHRHWIFQSYLSRLQKEGVLLAAVTRNEPEIVEEALRHADMFLQREQFVSVLASWSAKSAQIDMLAKELNLGLDSFVFVDDNPLEIAEVAAALPDVTTLTFPAKVDALPSFFSGLMARFSRSGLTSEDTQKTEMYRRRLATLAPRGASGASLEGFLQGLEMKLTLHDRSQGDRDRSMQLINKTNQFNLNGRRWSDEDLRAILDEGGQLWSASLEDRSGSHGEVIAALIDGSGCLRAWVMSCRIFQRRVEFAFLAKMPDCGVRIGSMDFASTDRNKPLRCFLQEYVSLPDEATVIQWPEHDFAEGQESNQRLFHWDEPAIPPRAA